MEEHVVVRSHVKSWLFLAAAVGTGVPAIVLSWSVILTGGPHLYPWLGSLVFGAGIVGAAFLLAWGAEVAQLDVSQALALAFVALVAVLPEYAVDFYLAWQAGADPGSQYTAYATANMTGGNRLIVGLGWPLVVLLFWIKRRSRSAALSRAVSTDLAFLLFGALYSVSIVFRGGIALWDTAVLFCVFALYIWLSSRAEHHEPELIGPALAVAALGAFKRRIVAVLLFLWAVGVIIFSTELFAEGLIATGEQFGIDEFILIQWLAPLASEAPELLVASYFALRGDVAGALAMLISATVNQWTLLIGSLPVAYSISAGAPHALPLTSGNEMYFFGYALHRQQVELLLTTVQTLFAVALVLRLRISWQGMAFLIVLFGGQLAFPHTEYRFAFVLVFLAAALSLLAVDSQRRAALAGVARYLWDVLKGRKPV